MAQAKWGFIAHYHKSGTVDILLMYWNYGVPTMITYYARNMQYQWIPAKRPRE